MYNLEREVQQKADYIKVARSMIEECGFDDISIRKIADKMGKNSATLYKYFEGIDILLLFASISYLKEYIEELLPSIRDIEEPKEKYLKVYEVFNKHSFNNPEIYFNLFYGPQSKHTKRVIEEYYILFPEELGNEEENEINLMLRQGDIINRDTQLTKLFLVKGIFNKIEVNYLIDIAVRVHSSYLYELIHKGADTEKSMKQFNVFLKDTIELLDK